MATRNTLQANEVKSPDKSAEEKISIEKVFAEIIKVNSEISKMNTKLIEVAVDVTTTKTTTADLKEAVSGLQVRADAAEERISALEDKTNELTTSNDTMGKKMDMLWDRVQMLENHSKRNNVRLVGLKETYGTNGTLEDCVKKVMREGLGIMAEGEFEIERIHRALAPKPNEGQPARPVLIRFLRQSARDKVLSAVSEKRGITWEGQHLSIFPNVTKELAAKRRSFQSAKKALQRRGVRYTLAFPAELRFRWHGRYQRFTKAAEAERFIDMNCNESDE